jgi:hypothetical protein
VATVVRHAGLAALAFGACKNAVPWMKKLMKGH